MGSEAEYWTALQKAVGDRMRQAAEGAGLNAYSVAERMGVRAPTVYRWWRGARVSQERMAEYATLVGRSPEWLYSGKEAPDSIRDFSDFFVLWAQAIHSGEDAAKAYETAHRRFWGEEKRLADPKKDLLREATEAMRQVVKEGTVPYFRGLTAEQRDFVAHQLTLLADAHSEAAHTSGAPVDDSNRGRTR
jgi:transcriptional regulator with XRE-family HTH domain